MSVAVNQKSLSRGCTAFKENAWVVLPSVILPQLHMCSVYKSRRAAVLKVGEKLKFLIPFASSVYSRRKPT